MTGEILTINGERLRVVESHEVEAVPTQSVVREGRVAPS